LLNVEDALIRLLVSLALGALVGLEREYIQKSAGLRTHILVCMGSTVFTLISISDLSSLSIPALGPLPEGYSVVINRDPGRIAAQIVTGIGFIGGGALLKLGNNVRGVTTAASLWMIASVGMLVGIGELLVATVATAASFLVLFTLGKVERVWFRKHKKPPTRLRLLVQVQSSSSQIVSDFIEASTKKMTLEVKSELLPDQELTMLTYMLDLRGNPKDWLLWRKQLEQKEGVLSVSLQFLESAHHPQRDLYRALRHPE
jgi:putative Mg2+ transporter-C (MgtC) family protein